MPHTSIVIWGRHKLGQLTALYRRYPVRASILTTAVVAVAGLCLLDVSFLATTGTEALRWFLDKAAGTFLGVFVGALAAWGLSFLRNYWLRRRVRTNVSVNPPSLGATFFAVSIHNGMEVPIRVRGVSLRFPSGGSMSQLYLGSDLSLIDLPEGSEPFLEQDRADVRGYVTIPPLSSGYWGLPPVAFRGHPPTAFVSGEAIIEYPSAFGYPKFETIQINERVAQEITKWMPRIKENIEARDQRDLDREWEKQQEPRVGRVLLQLGQGCHTDWFQTRHLPPIGASVRIENPNGKVFLTKVVDIHYVIKSEKLIPKIICDQPVAF